MHFSSPRRSRPRFWRVSEHAGLGFRRLGRHVLPCTSLRLAFHNIMLFMNAVTTLLHLPALCFFPFRCGGLCAAHGILCIKHIVLTRLGTESGAADFLRSAHATDPAIGRRSRKFSRKFFKKIDFAYFRTSRRVWEVESYAPSKSQPPTTLGDPQNVEKSILKI